MHAQAMFSSVAICDTHFCGMRVCLLSVTDGRRRFVESLLARFQGLSYMVTINHRAYLLCIKAVSMAIGIMK